MARGCMGAGALAGCLLLWCGAAPVRAQQSDVAKMLAFKPKQAGVIYTIPTPQEQQGCIAKRIEGPQGNKIGWVLLDAHGSPLRRFVDTNGDIKLDQYSYYLDGVEVYREIDSHYKGKVDQYRWLNAGGMKWGIDLNGNGKIGTWRMISTEEASQEILQAVITNDFTRLQALWITDAEMNALELTAAEINRIHALQKQAAAKFQSAVAKLSALGGQTHWVRLEAGPPQCVPADATGMKRDLIKLPRGAILYENNGKHDWLSTGEMIQVGLAWRLIDAPAAGDVAAADTNDNAAPLDPEVKRLLDELKNIDGQAPRGQETPGPNPAIVRYNLQRAGVLQKIIAKVKLEERDQWTRQLADCYSAAAQSSPENDKRAYERLVQLEQQTVKDQPGSALAAYVTFREMSADYAAKLVKQGPEFADVQKQWLERLAKFVQDYPQAEDAPDALMQLGMVNEFLSNEIAAKKWYQQLATNFAGHALAAKAQGAVRRLDLEGKVLELQGPLAGGGTFDIARLRGKLVIVYYWWSWNQQYVGDFARLKLVLGKYANQGLELVCINLDSSPPEADSPLTRMQLPGVQLFQPGGLESPLATQYGIIALPNLFLVGKDGRVISRTVQINNLEEEIKKQLK